MSEHVDVTLTRTRIDLARRTRKNLARLLKEQEFDRRTISNRRNDMNARAKRIKEHEQSLANIEFELSRDNFDDAALEAGDKR